MKIKAFVITDTQTAWHYFLKANDYKPEHYPQLTRYEDAKQAWDKAETVEQAPKVLLVGHWADNPRNVELVDRLRNGEKTGLKIEYHDERA